MLTALLEEGHTIERVGFIQEGKCLAYAKVPNTPRPVQVSNTASCCMITGKGRIERKDREEGSRRNGSLDYIHHNPPGTIHSL